MPELINIVAERWRKLCGVTGGSSYLVQNDRSQLLKLLGYMGLPFHCVKTLSRLASSAPSHLPPFFTIPPNSSRSANWLLRY